MNYIKLIKRTDGTTVNAQVIDTRTDLSNVFGVPWQYERCFQDLIIEVEGKRTFLSRELVTLDYIADCIIEEDGSI